ncbi:hypothetical protein Ddc_03062 [Ditylenchus destructor]|nr:hypothetical protein Ddc_03062 [Ditylenchus destructor]
MYHTLETQRKSMLNRGAPISCHTHFIVSQWISSSCEEYYQTVEGKSLLWQLNVLAVVTQFLSDIASLVSHSLGHCVGGFIASFLEELPWVVQIFAILIVGISLLSLGFAIFGYKFTLAYGFLTITHDNSTKPAKCNCVDLKPKSVTNKIVDQRLPHMKSTLSPATVRNK